MVAEQVSGYGPDEYFAFVESLELFAAPGGGTKGGAMRGIVDPLLDRRADLGYPKPTALVWLDCVVAEYFWKLDWRKDSCRIGDAAASARRRQQIRELDPSKMRVVLLPLGSGGPEEDGITDNLRHAAWHRVVLSSDARGLPSETGTDFDLEADGRGTRYFRYLGRCSEDEHRSLVNVFSLDFLPDADFGDGERGEPNTPPRPVKPRSGLALFKPFRKKRERPMIERTHAGEAES
jgi:hypothetical protein